MQRRPNHRPLSPHPPLGRGGWICIVAALVVVGCSVQPRYRRLPSNSPSDAHTVENLPPARAVVSTEGAYQVGVASYYAHKFHGRKTANGETFDMYGMTAAHRELPLGTVIRVTHLENGRSIEVRVNDRGPFIPGRVLDLSLGAAQRLDLVEAGVAHVMIEIIELE